MKTIEVMVSSTGEVTVKTQGFQGSSCREASQFIERALGKVAGEKLTSEFHQIEVSHQREQQQS